MGYQIFAFEVENSKMSFYDSVLHVPSNNDRLVIESLTPFSSYQVYLRNGNDPFDVKSETVYFNTSGQLFKDIICSDSFCFSVPRAKGHEDNRSGNLGVPLVTLVSRDCALLQEMGSDISKIRAAVE